MTIIIFVEIIIKMARENNGTVTAAMVGLDTRATMDMDATIKGLPMNEQAVREMYTQDTVFH